MTLRLLTHLKLSLIPPSFKNPADYENPTGTGDEKNTQGELYLKLIKVQGRERKTLSLLWWMYMMSSTTEVRAHLSGSASQRKSSGCLGRIAFQKPEQNAGEKVFFSLENLNENDGGKFSIDPETGMLLSPDIGKKKSR